MAQIALKQKAALEFVHGRHISRPNAQIVLPDCMGRDRIVVITIVHLEFQHVENSLKNDIELLDHLPILEFQLLFEIERDLNGTAVLDSLTLGSRADFWELFGEVQFHTIESLQKD